MTLVARLGAVLPALGLLGCLLGSCSPGEQAGSQTNWLRSCETSEDCGGLECICGACTLPCRNNARCSELPGTSCLATDHSGAVALCGGMAPPSALCLPTCNDDSSCSFGTACVAGACQPLPEHPAQVRLDLFARYQTLTGFGAGLAFCEDEIAAHPEEAALYDAMFAESGFDAVRIRNRYDDGKAAELTVTREILDAAEARIGRRPTLLLTPGSPPAALKANASRTCSGDPVTCTLSTLADGSFDYDGLGAYFRASLDAYQSAGIAPDYLGLQNNPNWVPPESSTNEACRYLPEEGTTSVTVDGTTQDVAYPGFREALLAVRAALADLSTVPRILSPEVSGVGAVESYVQALDRTDFDAVALHLYGIESDAVDTSLLESVKALAADSERPVFQTEMRGNGLETAILVHYALTSLGASLYLQNDVVSSATSLDEDPAALIRLTEDGFETQAPYHALRHYARFTDPGWVRVDATSESSNLLASAWLSPSEDALTVVLVNPATENIDAALALPDEIAGTLTRSEVSRTTFDGLERSAALGAHTGPSIVKLPPHSVVTVRFFEP